MRLVAVLVDYLISFFAGVGSTIIIFAGWLVSQGDFLKTGASPGEVPDPPTAFEQIGAVSALTAPFWFPLLYFIRWTYIRGQTEVKKGDGLKVVKSDGLTPSFGRIVVRETTKFAPFYLLLGFSLAH